MHFLKDITRPILCWTLVNWVESVGNSSSELRLTIPQEAFCKQRDRSDVSFSGALRFEISLQPSIQNDSLLRVDIYSLFGNSFIKRVSSQFSLIVLETLAVSATTYTHAFPRLQYSQPICLPPMATILMAISLMEMGKQPRSTPTALGKLTPVRISMSRSASRSRNEASLV